MFTTLKAKLKYAIELGDIITFKEIIYDLDSTEKDPDMAELYGLSPLPEIDHYSLVYHYGEVFDSIRSRLETYPENMNPQSTPGKRL